MEQGIIEYFKLSSKISTSNMRCFDAEGKIKKYNSPEEIIEDFYSVRLAFYQKRKAGFTSRSNCRLALTLSLQDFLSSDLQFQLDKLTNQIRFVQMIINKELVVSNRKKADIVAELRKKEFKPIPKVEKKKGVKDTEEVAEEVEDEDSEGNSQSVNSADFDYLLGMAIHSLTQEKASPVIGLPEDIFSCRCPQIARLLQQRDEREKELVALLKRTAIDVWTEDLNTFLVEWEVFLP